MYVCKGTEWPNLTETRVKSGILIYHKSVILLNSVHTRNLQVLAIFHNLAANEHRFLLKASKILINTPN